MKAMDDKISYTVLINESSGTVLREGQTHIEDVIRGEGGSCIKDVHFLPMKILLEEARQLISKKEEILIGGGDGTLKAAAENLEGAFGILPMGTMNLLAVDLGIPCDIKEAVQAYVGKPYKIIEIDTAYVNGEAFYCSAAIGLIPRSAVYREKHRHDPIFLLIPQLGLSILDHMDVQKYGQNFTVKMDMARKHKRLHTSNLIITNNEYEYVNGGQPIHFKRHSLQNNKLGIYTTRPRTLWDKLRVLAHFKFGDWTKDPAIKSWICEKLRVNCNEQKLTISLDGENIEVETPLEFHIDPQSRPLLVPGLDEQEEAA